MHKLNNSFNFYPIKKTKNNLLFSNEYYAELFKVKKKNNYNLTYIKSFKDLQKYNYSEEKFVLKKLKKFRYLLTKKLNKIHSTRLSENYWGIHLDFYLLFIIRIIHKEFN